LEKFEQRCSGFDVQIPKDMLSAIALMLLPGFEPGSPPFSTSPYRKFCNVLDKYLACLLHSCGWAVVQEDEV